MSTGHYLPPFAVHSLVSGTDRTVRAVSARTSLSTRYTYLTTHRQDPDLMFPAENVRPLCP